MNLAAKEIIDQWISEAGSQFSYEGRYMFPVSSVQLAPNSGFEFVNFVIEVSGFFYDEEHTKPIKLHHERTISIDNTNLATDYLDDLRHDIKLFTDSAHESFIKILSESPGPVYTSDILHMK